MRIKLEVHCDCGERIGTYYDSIYEKYPFFCPECDDLRMEKWPWKITATVEQDPICPGDENCICGEVER